MGRHPQVGAALRGAGGIATGNDNKLAVRKSDVVDMLVIAVGQRKADERSAMVLDVHRDFVRGTGRADATQDDSRSRSGSRAVVCGCRDLAEHRRARKKAVAITVDGLAVMNGHELACRGHSEARRRIGEVGPVQTAQRVSRGRATRHQAGERDQTHTRSKHPGSLTSQTARTRQTRTRRTYHSRDVASR